VDKRKGVGMNYKTIKRLVYAIKDFDGMTLRDANTMIYDSCDDALESLDDEQREIIELQIQLLQIKAEKEGQRLGRKGALEIIAAVSEYVA
jgi:hypothetical protein